MPIIGARFYNQLDTMQGRNDILERELAKVIPPSASLLPFFSEYKSDLFVEIASSEERSESLDKYYDSFQVVPDSLIVTFE